jgi:hypothetical protein
MFEDNCDPDAEISARAFEVQGMKNLILLGVASWVSTINAGVLSSDVLLHSLKSSLILNTPVQILSEPLIEISYKSSLARLSAIIVPLSVGVSFLLEQGVRMLHHACVILLLLAQIILLDLVLLLPCMPLSEILSTANLILFNCGRLQNETRLLRLNLGSRVVRCLACLDKLHN